MLQGKLLFINEAQSNSGSYCSVAGFEMQDSMVAAAQPHIEGFNSSAPILLLSLAVTFQNAVENAPFTFSCGVVSKRQAQKWVYNCEV